MSSRFRSPRRRRSRITEGLVATVRWKREYTDKNGLPTSTTWGGAAARTGARGRRERRNRYPGAKGIGGPGIR